MTDALDLFRPDAGGNANAGTDAPGSDAPGAALPDFLGFRPARPPCTAHASILVFTDTVTGPRDPRTMQRAFAVGARVVVEPCGPVPLFPGLYLVALRGAGFALARLRPLLGGGFALSYDNPAYEGWTVTAGAIRRGDVRALCRVLRETYDHYGDPTR